MYADSTRWSATFQSYVQLTMLEQHLMEQVVIFIIFGYILLCFLFFFYVCVGFVSMFF